MLHRRVKPPEDGSRNSYMCSEWMNHSHLHLLCKFFKDTHQKLRYERKPIKYFKTTEPHTVCIWRSRDVRMWTTVSDAIWRLKKSEILRFISSREHKILLWNLGCSLKKMTFWSLLFLGDNRSMFTKEVIMWMRKAVGARGGTVTFLSKRDEVGFRSLF